MEAGGHGEGSAGPGGARGALRDRSTAGRNPRGPLADPAFPLTGQEAEAGGHGGHKKKHKKHKKKHKKRHHHEAGPAPGPEPPRQPRLRLRIKLGGQILGTKSVPTFTVVPERPRSPSPSPLLAGDEEEPSVPIEQYRAWLGE
ncbi:INO80 complex subunit B, partial [Lonchura striata]